MRHKTSHQQANINAEVEARRQAAIRKTRAMWDCPDCIREEQPGETRVHDCGKH